MKRKWAYLLLASICFLTAAGESFADNVYFPAAQMSGNARPLDGKTAAGLGRTLSEIMEGWEKEAKIAAKEGRGADVVAVFRGHRYYLFYGGCATWEDARAYCESLGGHLATVENAEENIVLHEYVSHERLAALYEPNRHPFLGLYYENREWKWVDGSPIAFTKWEKGKSGGSEKRAYARMLYSDWKAAEFKNSAFLCEWESENENVPMLPEVDMQPLLEQYQKSLAVSEKLWDMQRKMMGRR